MQFSYLFSQSHLDANWNAASTYKPMKKIWRGTSFIEIFLAICLPKVCLNKNRIPTWRRRVETWSNIIWTHKQMSNKAISCRFPKQADCSARNNRTKTKNKYTCEPRHEEISSEQQRRWSDCADANDVRHIFSWPGSCTLQENTLEHGTANTYISSTSGPPPGIEYQTTYLHFHCLVFLSLWKTRKLVSLRLAIVICSPSVLFTYLLSKDVSIHFPRCVIVCEQLLWQSLSILYIFLF